MNNIFTKLSNMINDEIKRCITKPMFNYLYNELYLHMDFVFYQIIYFIIILLFVMRFLKYTII